MNEGPLVMVLHGSLFGVVAYLIMKFALGQSDSKALNRSVLLGLVVAAYMVVFGHNLPTRVNSKLL